MGLNDALPMFASLFSHVSGTQLFINMYTMISLTHVITSYMRIAPLFVYISGGMTGCLLANLMGNAERYSQDLPIPKDMIRDDISSRTWGSTGAVASNPVSLF